MGGPSKVISVLYTEHLPRYIPLRSLRSAGQEVRQML